jgi:hypothetical protein
MTTTNWQMRHKYKGKHNLEEVPNHKLLCSGELLRGLNMMQNVKWEYADCTHAQPACRGEQRWGRSSNITSTSS